jgi:hypothetical protein
MKENNRINLTVFVFSFKRYSLKLAKGGGNCHLGTIQDI